MEGSVTSAETYYTRDDGPLPATIWKPAAGSAPAPGWIVLHGLTRTGREHPSLVRFARSMARAGNIVMIPEIPEWMDLRIAPAITLSTIRAAVRTLRSREDVLTGRVGLIGFSFGATQALNAAADPGTAALLSGIAAWGGYCDLRRVCRFGLTGLHEFNGVTYQTTPDPYGTWIMAGNYLPLTPGHEDSRAVADALHALALEAGERGTYAGDPIYDVSKRRLRAELPASQRDLFGLLAPETTITRRDTERLLELAERLADAALSAEPLLDPRPQLPRVTTPVLFAHGRDDRLIPFSETVDLARRVPDAAVRSVTVTSLFQHSGGTQSGLGPIGYAREAARFLGLLHRLLRLA